MIDKTNIPVFLINKLISLFIILWWLDFLFYKTNNKNFMQ